MKRDLLKGYCTNYGGPETDVVKIDPLNEEILQVLHDELQTQGKDLSKYYYIGAKQEQNGSPYLQTFNGPDVPSTGSYWATGEPSAEHEKCLVVKAVQGTMKLFDWDCEAPNVFICQIWFIGELAI